MTETTSTIVQKSEAFCTPILTKLPGNLAFHNLHHTKQVVEAAEEILNDTDANDVEKEITLVAAWFHDAGFAKAYEGHEEHSSEMARDFLHDQGWEEGEIEKVTECILATRNGKIPETECGKILCDADMVHLSQKSYFDQLELLKKERESQSGEIISERTWHEENLLFLTKHRYYTTYGREKFAPKKLKNIEKQQKVLRKLDKKEDAVLMSELQVDVHKLKKLKKKLNNLEGIPERGIETMFRVTSRNHIDLSSMADNKANILISVNSIIISILIGFLTSKLDSNPHLIFPTFFLIGVSVTTIVFSILATRPNITKGIFTQEDINKRKANLLFFGNFHSMTREEYKDGMFATMKDRDYLYSSMIDDIYFNGRVLGKKYKFLRVAYNIFMYGIIIAVLSFLVVNYSFIDS